MGNSDQRRSTISPAMPTLTRRASFLAALSSVVLFTGCDVACLKNPISRERALDIARDYLLTHTIADFEKGPPSLQRFAKALRDDGIDDSTLRRIASTQNAGRHTCDSHSNFYEVHEDPIALQGYLVHFKEHVVDALSPDSYTVRMLVVDVVYCGQVLWGDPGPTFSRSKKTRYRETPKCR